MSLLIKICGLSTASTLEAALGAGADMVGFVFFPPSPRSLEPAQARALGATGARAGAQGRPLRRRRRFLSRCGCGGLPARSAPAPRQGNAGTRAGAEASPRIAGDEGHPCERTRGPRRRRGLRGRSRPPDLRRPPAQGRGPARRQRRGVRLGHPRPCRNAPAVDAVGRHQSAERGGGDRASPARGAWTCPRASRARRASRTRR